MAPVVDQSLDAEAPEPPAGITIAEGRLLIDGRALHLARRLLESGARGQLTPSNLPGYAPLSQAEAVAALAREIEDASAAGHVIGGTVFEWADEWWKDAGGSVSAQDVGGEAPGNGPYPDGVFNEEWWGLVDMERQPRPAFDALREVFRASP